MERKIFVLAIFLTALFANAAAAGNYTEIKSQMEDAEQAIQQMENEDIPTERVESLLTTANRSFIAQKELAETQRVQPDFSRPRELSSRIMEIQKRSMRVNDRISSLEERINRLKETNLNLTEVKQAFQKLNSTFQNQRFEEAENQVENVYREISEARSVQTQLEAFASAQRQNLETFYSSSVNYATDNWKKLGLGAALGTVLLVIFVREYKIWRLEKRREDMIGKKKVIENMIEEAQEEYYVKGKGSKIAFETRMDKLQEMMRNTEQEINELETQLQSTEGLPMISPEIKEKTEDFKAEEAVMEEAGEVEGSLERISERREQSDEGKEAQKGVKESKEGEEKPDKRDNRKS